MHNAKIMPTEQYPIVYADWLHEKEKPTLLFYGHYDVQPVEPVTDWHTHPFKPIINNNYIYGRGSSDDKGQMFIHLKAIEYYLKTYGYLPVNIKCLFEGEEEIGSPSLSSFLKSNKNIFAADFSVISDTSIPAPDQPAVTYTQRGALNMDLQVRGSEKDLHSGSFGVVCIIRFKRPVK